MQIRSAVETISPEVAERILTASGNEVKNRKVRDGHVEWMAGQMREKKWQTNGEPIILDEDGLLLDGQHRLYAVVESGIAIETLVTRGVQRSTFSTIDTGAVRSTSDVLGIADEKYAAILAGALGWL